MHISNANWPNLIKITLRSSHPFKSECEIGDLGCFYLSKANWPKLADIDLGICDKNRPKQHRKCWSLKYQQSKLAQIEYYQLM